ncbi:MAG TPA: hypothetical protein VKA50_10720 [Gammaproteobacteria bacterium]|nr:hypothetical protein [Gammaproteobacteria bacterium]
MDFGSSDIDTVAEVIDLVGDQVMAAYRASGPYSPDVVSPELLAEALRQFVDVVRRIEAGAGETGETTAEADITELGDHALSLLQDLSQWAAQLRLAEARERLDALSVPVALWVARRGGYINDLEPVVNTLAVLANSTQDPATLAELSRVMGEITAAVAPALRQDLDRSEPGRPWRILNLNRGIVATRTQDPQVMTAVFDELVHNLPEDAPAFFAEGMEQMDALNYPAEVREVVENYHRRFVVKTLH